MLASINFSALYLSCSGFALVALTMLAAPFGVVAIAGIYKALLGENTPSAPLEFRVARDGRSYVKIGRLCYWGRRGESFASIVNRYGL